MAERLGAGQESPADPSNTRRNKPTTEGTFGRSRGRPGRTVVLGGGLGTCNWPGPYAPARSRHALPRSFWRWIRGCEPAIHRQNGHGAEGVGFEPTVPEGTHALQACRFGRSRIPPGVTVPSVFRPPLGAVAGSCATGTREPSQGRKAAALSGPFRVPQSSLAAAPNGGPRCR